jgi:hypothetical protein
MQITSFKNEDAIDVLADLIEPAGEIFSDTEILQSIRNDKTKIAHTVRLALKKHNKAVVEILAVLNGMDVEAYKKTGLCTPVTVLKDCIEIVNDKELKDFFISQAKMMAEESSILPAENTEEKEQ